MTDVRRSLHEIRAARDSDLIGPSGKKQSHRKHSSVPMVRSYSPMCTLASSMCLSEVEESCAAALPFRTPKRGRASLMTPNSHVSPIVEDKSFPFRQSLMENNLEKTGAASPTTFRIQPSMPYRSWNVNLIALTEDL
ncbi:unnamed protein product [Nezara viridula]|uniref:Uncharacterized protein n=1 Tax=Nezara viridula TaxID=85310 RepID=A0A9P0HBQ2_NEZVI|nr:unnamed protein product [Nezara viridula]